MALEITVPCGKKRAADPLVKIIICGISTAFGQKHEQISKGVILNAYNTGLEHQYRQHHCF